MYTDFYKLKAKPFRISSDQHFIWLGEKHREALSMMKYAVLDNKGFMLLTGDVGTGKTTLINTLIDSLGTDVFYASVPDPRLDLGDFLDYLGQAYHIDTHFESKGTFLLHFGWFLEAAYKQNKKVLLIVDEAQLLTQNLLEEIRLLSNIHRDGNHLLNIFFVGQNEFNEILGRPENRAVSQRLTLNYQIGSLSLKETDLYIRHRLKIAGSAEMLFSGAAVKEIYSYSGGVPRRINIICDHCLLTGYVQEKRRINAETVKNCTRDIEIPKFVPPRPPAERPETAVPADGAADGAVVGAADGAAVGEEAVPSAGYQLTSLLAAVGVISLALIAALAVLFIAVPEKFIALYRYAGTYVEGRVEAPPPEQARNRDGQEPGPAGSQLRTPASRPAVVAAPDRDEKAVAGSRLPEAGGESAPAPGGPKTGPSQKGGPAAAQAVVVTQVSPPSAEPPAETGAGVELPAVRAAGTKAASLAEGAPGSDASRSAESLTQIRKEAVEPLPPLPTDPLVIRFGNNSNDFNQNDLELLARLGTAMRHHSEAILKISGYTDSIGSDDYNARLSLFRANMVKSYLLGQKVRPQQMIVQGAGSDNPIAENTSEEGRRMNRRVEIIVVNR